MIYVLRMTDTIFVHKNAFSPHVCQQIIRFINSHEEWYNPRSYEDAGNNVMCDCINLEDFQRKNAEVNVIDAFIAAALSDALNSVIPKIRKEVGDSTLPFGEHFSDTGYELRRIRGPTRMHNDNVNISILRTGQVRYRFASVCICLSDSGDDLVFPVQDKTIRYEPGMLVLFPNSWAYPHYTTYGDMPNYRIQTWLALNVDPRPVT